jgi:hypothetical protein
MFFDLKAKTSLRVERESLAGDDKCSRGNACLFMEIEAEQIGNAAGALSR